MIIFGIRLYGRTDKVQKRFYVATRFAHLYYVPLIPLDSHVVCAEGGGDFSGVKIPISFKSILTAWLRVVSGFSAIGFALVMFQIFTRGGPFELFVIAAAKFVAAASLLAGSYTPFWMNASTRRAAKLVQWMKPAGGIAAHLAGRYEEDASRGFEVVISKSTVDVTGRHPPQQL